MTTSTRPILAAFAVLLAGCANPVADYADRVEGHVRPMKPVYDHGIATFPGATDLDRRIWRQHWADLQTLLDAPTTRPAVTP